jgi:hypothetical protein
VRRVLTCSRLNTAVRCLRTGPLFLLLLGAALVGCSSTAQQNSTGGRDRSGGRAKGSRPPRPISHVEHRLLAHFSILKGPPEEVPVSLRQALRHPVFGINLEFARRIPAEVADSTFWILPGNAHICVVSEVNPTRVVTTVCESTPRSIAHGIAVVSISPSAPSNRTRTILGVAPDGAQQALIRTNGATSTAPIHNELFILEDSTPKPPEQISLR